MSSFMKYLPLMAALGLPQSALLKIVETSSIYAILV